MGRNRSHRHGVVRAGAAAPQELLDWLDYVEARCPECEGESKWCIVPESVMPTQLPLLIGVVAILAFEHCGLRRVPSEPSATHRLLPACPRPIDADGRPLYDSLRGGFMERGVDAGGGYFVVIKRPEAVASESVPVTQEAYEALAPAARSRPIALFAYVTNALSGAHPLYSCVES